MKCKEFEQCGNEHDDRYTMNFDDFGEEPIYWCFACGPFATELRQKVEERLKDPKFVAMFEKEVNKHYQ